MRIFVGVELGPDVRERAASVAGRLRRDIETLRPPLDLRWVPPENLHITLWFIGNVEEARALAVRSALERPFATPAFDLPIGGCGAFPRSGPPRVVWIGTRAAADMSQLYAEVRDRLVPLGFEEERRPYAAHVTVARVRDAAARGRRGRRGADGGRALRDLLGQTPADCGISRVSAVTLFLSRLSPKGAAYEPVLRVPLGGTGQRVNG